MKTNMIEKLWVSIISNKIVTIKFILSSLFIVLAYQVEATFYVVIFGIILVVNMHQLAKTSTVYDVLKRKGDI